MDIIVDTNILRQDRWLKSPKFQAIFDYLKKTKSHLIIPTIVKQEIISLFRRDLTDLYEQVKNKTRKINDIRYSDIPKIEVYLDINKEASIYESFLNKLIRSTVALEIPYDNEFLGDVIRRLVDRIKPASDKGEEFQDIIIWLSIKKFLKETKREAILISQNTKEFAAKDSKELHPDLGTELEKDNLKLKYYCSMDDFISEHKSKIDYIDDKWILTALHQVSFKNIVSTHIKHNIEFWQNYANIEGLVLTGDIFVDFVLIDVENYYLYEIEGGDLFIHISCLGTILVELQVEHRKEYKTVYEEIFVEAQGKIHQQNLKSLTIDWWGFTDDKLEERFWSTRFKTYLGFPST